MAVGDRKDPFRGYNFRFELNNTPVAAFSEVSGLSFTIDPVEYREGTDPQIHPRKLAGLRKFANIVLKRGYTDNTDLYDWYLICLDGAIQRRDGAVILQDEDRNDVLRWDFSGAFPTKIETSGMNANSNEVLIETLELAVERVGRE